MKVSFRKLNEGEVVLGYRPTSKQHNVEFVPKGKVQHYIVIIDNQILGVVWQHKINSYAFAQLYEDEGWNITIHKKCQNFNDLEKKLIK